MLVEATMVEVTLTITLTHALLLPLLHKVLILNPLVTALSTMWVGQQVLVPNRTTLQRSAVSVKALGTPSTKLERLKAQTPQPQGVSFSTDAYLSACAVHEADACLSSSSPAARAGTIANMLNMSAILAGIGPPVPCNAMPDPAAVNTDFARDPMGYVVALSSNGPKVMFKAELAVKGDTIAAKALVDTSATHCYVSEEYIKKTTLPIRQQHTWLSLADASKAISFGKAVLPVDNQSYQGAVECFVIPMCDHFDLILGEDWCETTNCEISFKTHSLGIDGRCLLKLQMDLHCVQLSVPFI